MSIILVTYKPLVMLIDTASLTTFTRVHNIGCIDLTPHTNNTRCIHVITSTYNNTCVKCPVHVSNTGYTDPSLHAYNTRYRSAPVHTIVSASITLSMWTVLDIYEYITLHA
jgi:hypothetical protein